MLKIGQLVQLSMEFSESHNGAPLPAGTIGIVVGDSAGFVQVALEGFGIRSFPGRLLEPYTPTPASDDFIAIIAALTAENAALTRRVVTMMHQRIQFGRS